MSFLLDHVCFIADKGSVRFQDLLEQISIIQGICGSICYTYKYNESNIDNNLFYSYYGLPPFNRNPVYKLSYKEYFSTRAFAVVLNHLESFKIVSKKDPNNWSMICEDDILIDDKNNFANNLELIFNDKPQDSDILWVSSGKRDLNCTYRNITGEDPSSSLNYKCDTRFFKVSESRYADCVLLKNSVAEKFLKEAEIYKISYPIDWEYNFWLKNNPQINSYWLQPAIIRQNPKFLN